MRERPILFNAPMVRAILDGRKTQTRRVVKPQPKVERDWSCPGEDGLSFSNRNGAWVATVWKASPLIAERCPHGKPGDRLWVRETWSPDHRNVYPCMPVVYRADGYPTDEDRRCALGRVYECDERRGDCLACAEFKWRPSIHMPRWASRLTLRITGVRIERLQDISDEDALAEGCSGHDPEPADEGGTIYAMKGRGSAPSPRAHFWHVWDEAYGGGEKAWARNPWVWVIEFERVERHTGTEKGAHE